LPVFGVENLSQTKPLATSERASSPVEKGHVIEFRPRTGLRRVLNVPTRQPVYDDSPVADLTKYERPETEDDYRHRMKMNGLAFIITCVLIISGLWLAEKMAEIRKVQDCVMSGRQNCAPIEAASKLRH
jgi:hypothetical protein